MNIETKLKALQAFEPDKVFKIMYFKYIVMNDGSCASNYITDDYLKARALDWYDDNFGIVTPKLIAQHQYDSIEEISE